MMKISVWQQFSSNHSTGFTVVGKFSSPEAAQKAEVDLDKVLGQIEKWWQGLTPAERINYQESPWIPQGSTSIESVLSEQHGKDWLSKTIWDAWNNADGYDAPVTYTYEHFLFVESLTFSLWYRPDPFINILRALGVEVTLRCESSIHSQTLLVVEIASLCPNEVTAKHIADEVTRFLQSNEDNPPWITYYKKHEIEEIKPARLAFNVNDFFVTVCERGEVPQEYLHVFQKDQKVIIRGFEIKENYDVILDAIVTWLKDQGCSEIDINFVEVGNQS
jgi:hypothetical protein